MATVKSFKEFVFDSLEAFLYREGFPVNPEVVKGIAFLANNICHYQEESIRLSPEILVSTDLTSIAKTLPTHIIIRIGQGPMTITTFKKALKGTAPLGRDNWIIYITVDSGSQLIHYGLLASGMSEPNPSKTRLVNSFHFHSIRPKSTRAASRATTKNPQLRLSKQR